MSNNPSEESANSDQLCPKPNSTDPAHRSTTPAGSLRTRRLSVSKSWALTVVLAAIVNALWLWLLVVQRVTPEPVTVIGGCLLLVAVVAKTAQAASDIAEGVRVRLSAVAAGATLIGSVLGVLGLSSGLMA